MERNNQPIFTASVRQGGDKYPGIDSYETTLLRSGTKICALIAYFETGAMKPCEFYFPQKHLFDSHGRASILCQGLQISPWQDRRSNKFLYKNRVATYVVIKDFEVEYSPQTTENSCYGTGGMAQYHIPPEMADEYLRKEEDDILLSDAEISEEEYDLIMEKREQLLIKRNLFSYLKSKSELLDIAQNTRDKEREKEAHQHLETISQHIDYLIMDLAYSQEQIGDIASPKYDKMISLLLDEITIREEEGTLFISNVKINKEIESTSQELNEKIDYNLIVPSHHDMENSIVENISQKMESSCSPDGNDTKKEIDVAKQKLYDIIQINQFNREGKTHLLLHGMREKRLLPITRLVMQGAQGDKKEYHIWDVFDDDSIRQLQNAPNGALSPLLKIKSAEIRCKILLQGNKTQLYLQQTAEKLEEQINHLFPDIGLTEHLKRGGEVEFKQQWYKIDRDLNALVPVLRREMPHPQQNIPPQHTHPRRSRGPS